MANRLKRLAKDTSYHGHAGLGSAFAALADKKVRPGGIVAFVLPFTSINGPSWTKFRELIAKHYTDVTILSIAANGSRYVLFVRYGHGRMPGNRPKASLSE